MIQLSLIVITLRHAQQITVRGYLSYHTCAFHYVTLSVRSTRITEVRILKKSTTQNYELFEWGQFLLISGQYNTSWMFRFPLRLRLSSSNAYKTRRDPAAVTSSFDGCLLVETHRKRCDRYSYRAAQVFPGAPHWCHLVVTVTPKEHGRLLAVKIVRWYETDSLHFWFSSTTVKLKKFLRDESIEWKLQAETDRDTIIRLSTDHRL